MKRAAGIAFLVAGTFFMENLDGTVITTAMPAMAHSFGVDAVSLNVGITAYLLAIAVFIPISGWIADRFGTRTVFCAAVAAFTLTSILCGLSQGLVAFTVARTLQGVAGALMVPVGRLAVLRSTAKSDLMRAIATITWPGLAAPILGPPLGGWITTHLSWHWIFFLNIPLGVVAFVLALRWIDEGTERSRAPFDTVGFLLTGLCCAAILVGMDQVGQLPASGGRVTALLMAGGLFGWAAVVHARRAEHPVVDLYALRYPTFSINIWGGSLFRIAIGATPFLLPLMFQEAMGMNPVDSGLLVLAVFAGNLSMKPATTWVLRTFGFRRVLIVNGVVTSALLAACAAFHLATPRPVMFVILFLGGLGRSMHFTCLNTIMFSDVPESKLSGANALSSTVGQLTFAMGVAMGAVLLRLFALRHRATLGPDLADFQAAFLGIAVIALLAVIDAYALSPDAGSHVSGHGRA